MPHDLLSRLKNEVLLIDSAMGTMLQEAGLKSGHECGEIWNISQEGSARVAEVHRRNVEAGSDIIITNTFGANRIKLEHYGAVDRLAQINTAAVKLARGAAAGKALVAADIGPTGDILEQWGGKRPAEEMFEAFREQAAALEAAGVDMFALETFMDIEEIKLALRAVRSVSARPVLASMSFQSGPAGLRTMWGQSPEEVAAELDSAGADIVGSNCGVTTKDMLEVVRGLARGSKRPVAAQPNAGAPSVSGDGHTHYNETAEQMAEGAKGLVEAGARLIGGCCGSTPDFIAAVKKAIHRA
ncbi:homocysteine S-methyltransferase family protein [bacterium]|nr:homocysteine S-methyltransferase family protein [bacterium]